MTLALALAVTALAAAAVRLWAYRRQMLEIARTLDETPAGSNLNLTVSMGGAPARKLCRAVNRRLEETRRLQQEALKREQELKFSMACVSHDIRTPLAGAMGYLQLLEGEPERRDEYLAVVGKRLGELEELLDSLFLYTRLQAGAMPVDVVETAALPPLYEALAEFYPRFEEAGVEPELSFESEGMTVCADRDALCRVYRNLIANALRHGAGGLSVAAGKGEICFSNPLPPGTAPDPERLFDRFYQGDGAMASGGAGLGLAIVRELMARMGGEASAEVGADMLRVRLMFRT